MESEVGTQLQLACQTWYGNDNVPTDSVWNQKLVPTPTHLLDLVQCRYRTDKLCMDSKQRLGTNSLARFGMGTIMHQLTWYGIRSWYQLQLTCQIWYSDVSYQQTTWYGIQSIDLVPLAFQTWYSDDIVPDVPVHDLVPTHLLDLVWERVVGLGIATDYIMYQPDLVQNQMNMVPTNFNMIFKHIFTFFYLV